MPLDLGVAGAVVRPWRRGDEESLVRHANNRKVWINLRDKFPHPYTPADAEQWIAFATGQEPQTNFAIAVGEEAVGGVGLDLKTDVERRSAEVGIWLGEAYWWKGIGTAAARAMTEYAFATFDVCRLYCSVFAWNGASMRILEKAGYTCEAMLKKAATKDGKTIDVYLYALVKDPPAR
ncbi:MAG: GNAT family N-acetyltransferase [Gemmatimonadales bacterium]|jgi:RimJ/RimL family protein N-acetyltransferase